MLKPLEDHILVKPIAQESTTASGIILPDSKEKPHKGEVIAVGDGKILENGQRSPIDVQTGDTVYFTQYAPDEIEVDENGETVKYLVVKHSSLLAKMFGALFGFVALAFTFTSASTLDDAIKWGYDEGLTNYSNITNFRPYNTLRRDEAAKFFVEFAEIEGYRDTSSSSSQSCSFSDENKIISNLKSYVFEACRYNFLKGGNGKIIPDQNLTNAQAVTIIVRILDGLQSESGVAHFSDNYYKRAKELGLDLSKFAIRDNPTTRGNVMILMYDVVKGISKFDRASSGDRDIDLVLKELTDILEGK